MSKIGAFTFVLHTHLPYARMAGRWPHGEEWLHEAAAETYVPLLDALHRLREDGIPAKLTISLTPILLEQLADEDVRTNFVAYLDDRAASAEGDISRLEASGDAHRAHLASVYRSWYQGIRTSFESKYGGNLVKGFRALSEAGILEIVTCAATHGYLPLLNRDESINLQLRTALETHTRLLGKEPRAIWLPECAYRPSYVAEDGRTRVGLEDFLARHGLDLFFAETHMVAGGKPVGMAAGEAIGPYGAVRRRYLVPLSPLEQREPTSVYRPYFVTKPQVAVIARDNRTGMQVWSEEWGYPGDFDYRDFHKKDGVSGMRYWRVTGADVDLAGKEPYQPDWATNKVEQHADHFVNLVEEVLVGFAEHTGGFGMISANYDTELFGHWWFEGVAWIEAVLRRLANSERVDLTTATDYLESHPPEITIQLPEGSWGAGGNHFVWDNADTRWMWPIIHEAEHRMAEVVTAVPEADDIQSQVLNQAARELLLLQSSDWPFLVTTAQAKEYAVQRFHQHVERFNRLLDSIDIGIPNANLASILWEIDKVFPTIDYRWYQP